MKLTCKYTKIHQRQPGAAALFLFYTEIAIIGLVFFVSLKFQRISSNNTKVLLHIYAVLS